MIECNRCKATMIEGSLYCDSCGTPLWDDAQGTSPTNELGDGPTAFSVKSGWGTATFSADAQVIVHIQGINEPVVITPKESILLGRMDVGAGIIPDLDLSQYGGNDQGVSRRHAIIEYKHSLLSIIDL